MYCSLHERIMKDIIKAYKRNCNKKHLILIADETHKVNYSCVV